MLASRLLIAIGLVGSTLTLGLPVASADLTVTAWDLGVYANEAGLSSFVIDKTVSNVFSKTRTATQGGSSNTTIYDFVWDAAGASFNLDFDHQRAGDKFSFAFSFGNPIKFTVTDVDLHYDLSGAYSMSGGQELLSHVRLFDVTAGNTVFNWHQNSRSSPNESFVVGQDGDGDFTDILLGSPSGTLLAGHNYSLFYDFYIRAVASDDLGATAMGDFHFNITPIPIPPGVELTQALIDGVFDLNLQNGIANSLDAKLDAILQALEDMNENNDVAACNALQAFINSVEAQGGNNISVADSDALISAAQAIILLLDCP